MRSEANAKKAESKEDKDDREVLFAADGKFPAGVKEKRRAMDAELAQRTKDGQTQTEALTKAVSKTDTLISEQ